MRFAVTVHLLSERHRQSDVIYWIRNTDYRENKWQFGQFDNRIFLIDSLLI